MGMGVKKGLRRGSMGATRGAVDGVGLCCNYQIITFFSYCLLCAFADSCYLHSSQYHQSHFATCSLPSASLHGGSLRPSSSSRRPPIIWFVYACCLYQSTGGTRQISPLSRPVPLPLVLPLALPLVLPLVPLLPLLQHQRSRRVCLYSSPLWFAWPWRRVHGWPHVPQPLRLRLRPRLCPCLQLCLHSSRRLS